VSAKYPIISVTGSSGAGTTSVRRTFEQIFRRERIEAAYIEGDAFNRYDRAEMSTVMAQEESKGNRNFSDFGPSANLLAELEAVFRSYHESGAGKSRHYVHDDEEAALYGCAPGTFTSASSPSHRSTPYASISAKS
jgi:phosphoribulokinase